MNLNKNTDIKSESAVQTHDHKANFFRLFSNDLLIAIKIINNSNKKIANTMTNKCASRKAISKISPNFKHINRLIYNK